MAGLPTAACKAKRAWAQALLTAPWVLAGLTTLPALAIVGGQPTEQFAEVGRWSTGASGVQVAPNWVLTARHIAPAVGAEFSNGLGSSTVAARYYFGHEPFPANDLALLRLATPLGSPQGRQITIWADRYSPGTLVPTSVTMVSGQNHAPRGYAWATLRQLIASRPAPVVTSPAAASSAASSALLAEATASPPAEAPAPLTVNHLLCHGLAEDGPYVQGGDSGGALFLGHVLDSDAPLLGLASAQTRFSDGRRTHIASAFVQLAHYREWIDRTMLEDGADDQQVRWQGSAAPTAWYQASWAYGVSGLSLTALMAGATALWRRRASKPG